MFNLLFNLYSTNVDHENQIDGVAVEKLWMDIQQAVYSSPSGSLLRNLACVDLQVDLCSNFTTEHQSRSKVRISLGVYVSKKGNCYAYAYEIAVPSSK